MRINRINQLYLIAISIHKSREKTESWASLRDPCPHSDVRHPSIRTAPRVDAIGLGYRQSMISLPMVGK